MFEKYAELEFVAIDDVMTLGQESVEICPLRNITNELSDTLIEPETP